MSDPRQPLEESQPAASAPAKPSDLAWSQRGGWRGCFDGRQSLAASFWLLGVGVSVLLTVSGRLVADALPFDAFRTVTLLTTLAIIATRVFAWYSIIKCRRNTAHPVFTALALILVSLDIVFGVFRWPAMIAAMIMV
jgi:hypothetical protein